MKLANYLDLSLIHFLDAKTRDKAIFEMVQSAYDAGFLESVNSFYKAIMEREKIISTGIGMGVSIPHAKLDNLQNFFISLGILKKRGLEWNSLDKTPVRLIFLIGGPTALKKEYLQLLSLLTSAIKQESFRRKLLMAASPQEVYLLFDR